MEGRKHWFLFIKREYKIIKNDIVCSDVNIHNRIVPIVIRIMIYVHMITMLYCLYKYMFIYFIAQII